MSKDLFLKQNQRHNKYLRVLLFEDNRPISAESVNQILSLNLAKTFLLLNFLITVLLYLFSRMFIDTLSRYYVLIKKLIDHTC